MHIRTYYRDRTHAGNLLAAQLQRYAGRSDVIVLALPRGGVPVAHPVAMSLRAPLDVLVVCKLGLPGNEEYALGAVGCGVDVVQPEIASAFAIGPAEIDLLRVPVLQEVERRERHYRPGLPPLALAGRTVLLVDDGLATGATMQAAVRVARKAGANRIVVAVPVGARDSVQKLRAEADEVVCMRIPQPFYAVGNWYDRFEQVSDAEVMALLDRAPPAPARDAPEAQPPRLH